MRPAVAAIQDEKQRMAVSDALLRCVTAQNQESDLSKILGAAQKNAQKAADSILQWIWTRFRLPMTV